ncbi:hypothetical protein ACFT2C_17430 [Promicromonospora sp. NPDC057138]|uniref:hypothetical protein n=1 Tax=Promicromonospora sp. NPDC057138 TaxID=3346031 RepID=UPI0036418818
MAGRERRLRGDRWHGCRVAAGSRGPALPSYVDDPELAEIVESGNMLRFMAYGAKARKEILPQVISDIWQAAKHS